MVFNMGETCTKYRQAYKLTLIPILLLLCYSLIASINVFSAFVKWHAHFFLIQFLSIELSRSIIKKKDTFEFL